MSQFRVLGYRLSDRCAGDLFDPAADSQGGEHDATSRFSAASARYVPVDSGHPRRYQYVSPPIFFGYRLATRLRHTPSCAEIQTKSR